MWEIVWIHATMGFIKDSFILHWFCGFHTPLSLFNYIKIFFYAVKCGILLEEEDSLKVFEKEILYFQNFNWKYYGKKYCICIDGVVIAAPYTATF